MEFALLLGSICGYGRMAIDQSSSGDILSLFDREDPRRAEDEYLRLFRKLVFFFDQGKCESPEDLAGETISRIVKKVAEGKEIRSESRYAYLWSVADYVRREYWKGHTFESLEDHTQIPEKSQPDLDKMIYMRECVEGALSGEEKALLRSWYEDGCEATAKRFGIRLENVRLKVHRIRNKVKEFAAAAVGKRETRD
jgi:hypothetical protein